MPRDTYTQVINGVEYSTRDAVLLAADSSWDGYSWEQPAAETFLYRNARGQYLALYLQHRPPAEARIVPLNRDTALALYRALPIHHWDERHAFRALRVDPHRPGHSHPPKR